MPNRGKAVKPSRCATRRTGGHQIYPTLNIWFFWPRRRGALALLFGNVSQGSERPLPCHHIIAATLRSVNLVIECLHVVSAAQERVVGVLVLPRTSDVARSAAQGRKLARTQEANLLAENDYSDQSLASVFTTWCRGICATSADIRTATASDVADFCCLLGTLRFLLQCDGGGHPEVVPF